MLSKRSVHHAVLALAAVLAVGCTPQLKVHVLRPASVNLGAARQLTVVQTEGRPGARGFLLKELSQRARQQGHFQVVDRSGEGTLVKVAGASVRILQDARGPAPLPDGIGIRIDVHDWDAARRTQLHDARDDKGKAHERQVTFYDGKAVVTVTAFTASGRALLAEQEYEAHGQGKQREEAIANAGREVVRRILEDITPQYETRYIRMDDGDRAQQPILEVAREGDVPRAVSEMESYVRGNPRNSTALYNLAVLLDAMGHYPEALERYTEAISLSAKDYYVDMKTECAGRLAEQRALSE
jgi:tetratricopeptide (TPR) repeat protein